MCIKTNRFVMPALAGFSVLFLAACGNIQGEAKYPTGLDRTQTGDDIYGKRESIFGKDGLKIFGGRGKGDDSEGGIGVNAFLWRAALDTISFMPLDSADPFGGVILTDWYTDPSAPTERVKINVLIVGRELKSDALRVSAFRQITEKGAWVDAPVAPETIAALEESILTRARQLRVTGLAGER